MINVFWILISFLCAGIHLTIRRKRPTKSDIVEALLLYAMIFWVGVIGFLFGFIPHVFFAEAVAQRIGWQTSPFQFEVGIHDGAWGLLGFLAVRYKGGFRVATGLGWSLFMLGAALGHVRDAIVHGNFAEYNFLMIFVDGFIALALPILLYLEWKWTERGQT